VPYETSSLRIAVYFPSVRNWNTEGDRTFGCIVFQKDYDLINGTLKDTRQ
jgi:hypothetical protein